MRNSSLKKVLVFTLSACILISLLTGCGSTQNKPEQTTANAQNTTQASSEQEKQTDAKQSGQVEYVSMWQSGEPAGIWWKEVASEFEKQTGITVKATFAGRDVLTKVKSRILMGDPPDIIDQGIPLISASYLADEIMLTPMDDYLNNEKGPEGQSKWADIFNMDMLKPYLKDGINYFIPFQMSTEGFFYDKSMFKEYNLTPPATWEDFIKLNETLKAKSIVPLAQDGTEGGYNAYYYFWACVRVLGPGSFLKAAVDETGTTWDDPGYLKAAEAIYELSKSGKNFFQEGYEGSTWPIAQADWALGRAGSIFCGSWIPVETSGQAKQGMEYGYYPFPAIEGGVGKTTDMTLGVFGAAIPKDAKNVKEAIEFLKFATNKDNAQKYAIDAKAMPMRIDVDYPAVLSDIKAAVSNGKVFFKGFDGANTIAPEWMNNVFIPVHNKLLFGKSTPSEFIKEIKQKTIDHWKSKK